MLVFVAIAGSSSWRAALPDEQNSTLVVLIRATVPPGFWNSATRCSPGMTWVTAA
jgi:hypothetical protein